MMNDFKKKLQKTLGEFLLSKGFNFEEFFELDEGNKSFIFYKSEFCKLCFYRSERDGEINCLVGAVDADNANVEEDEWVFFRSLLSERKEFSIEEMLKFIPDFPRSDEDQLSEIALQIKSNFNNIVETWKRQFGNK